MINETQCKVVYLSEQPPEQESANALFDGFPDLLTTVHLAKITGQCEATVRALCAKGDLPAVRIGRRWYVPKTSMVAYVEGRKR